MNISIFGANGTMGTHIASLLIQSGILARSDFLQLVGRSKPDSKQKLDAIGCLEGMRWDLQDGYGEMVPHIDVIDVRQSPERINGDIVVMAAGPTPAILHSESDTTPCEQCGSLIPRAKTQDSGIPRPKMDRDRNLPEVAEACSNYGLALKLLRDQKKSCPLIVVVTNPVEFVVEFFAKLLEPLFGGGSGHFVIGMGGYIDTLRFRQELARDFGVPRERVLAEIVGEHGDLMVARWSTIKILGMKEADVDARIYDLMKRDQKAQDADFSELFATRIDPIRERLQYLDLSTRGADIENILQEIEEYRADYRATLKPWVIHNSGSRTAHATASATVRLIQGLVAGDPVVSVVQRMVSYDVISSDHRTHNFGFGFPYRLRDALPMGRRGREAYPDVYEDFLNSQQERSRPESKFRQALEIKEHQAIEYAAKRMQAKSFRRWEMEQVNNAFRAANCK